MKTLRVFTAEWCGPCKQMSPLLDALALQGIKVERLDVLEHRDLVQEHGIRSVPTLMLYERDNLVASRIGGMTAHELQAFTA